jgi:hypothetical protein
MDPTEPADYNLGRVAFTTFKEESFRSFADPAYDVLKEQLHESDRAIRRSFVLVLAAAVLFELLIAARVNEISILGVTITDPTWPLLLVPILASALYGQALIAAASYNVYSDLIRCLLQARQPMLERNRLQYFFIPGASSFVSSLEIVDRWAAGRRWARVFDRSFTLMYFLLLMTPVVYGVIAYARLYERSGLNDIAVSGSLLISAVISATGVIGFNVVLGINSDVPTLPRS